MGIPGTFRPDRFVVEVGCSGVSGEALERSRCLGVCIWMATGVLLCWALRGIPLAWLFAEPARRFSGILVGGNRTFACIFFVASEQSRRICSWTADTRGSRLGFLLESLVHQITLVGDWIPHRMGLGRVLHLWNAK